jgi:arylsulfatase A-like enzyme
MVPVLPHPDYPDLDTELMMRKTREYLASISGVDRNVGKLLQTLAQLKLEANTLVIFTSDHGYNMGHNGIHHKGNGVWATKTLPEPTPNVASKYRPNLYDNSLKVPAIVRWPGVIEPGIVIDDSTTSLDWYPTLVQIAGAKLRPQHPVRGRSLLPLLRGTTPADWDQNVYAEYSMIHYSRAFMRTYRTPDWKLVRDFLNPERDELYHLAIDPQERVNLIHADETEVHAVVRRLDQEIRRNMRAINDSLLEQIPTGFFDESR